MEDGNGSSSSQNGSTNPDEGTTQPTMRSKVYANHDVIMQLIAGLHYEIVVNREISRHLICEVTTVKGMLTDIATGIKATPAEAQQTVDSGTQTAAVMPEHAAVGNKEDMPPPQTSDGHGDDFTFCMNDDFTVSLEAAMSSSCTASVGKSAFADDRGDDDVCLIWMPQSEARLQRDDMQLLSSLGGCAPKGGGNTDRIFSTL